MPLEKIEVNSQELIFTFDNTQSIYKEFQERCWNVLQGKTMAYNTLTALTRIELNKHVPQNCEYVFPKSEIAVIHQHILNRFKVHFMLQLLPQAIERQNYQVTVKIA